MRGLNLKIVGCFVLIALAGAGAGLALAILSADHESSNPLDWVSRDSSDVLRKHPFWKQPPPSAKRIDEIVDRIFDPGRDSWLYIFEDGSAEEKPALERTKGHSHLVIWKRGPADSWAPRIDVKTKADARRVLREELDKEVARQKYAEKYPAR